MHFSIVRAKQLSKGGVPAQAGVAPLGDQYYQEVRDTTVPHFVGITETHPWFGITVQFSKPMNAAQFSQHFAGAVSIRDSLNRLVPVTAVNMVPFSDGLRFDIRFAAQRYFGIKRMTVNPAVLRRAGFSHIILWQDEAADFAVYYAE